MERDIASFLLALIGVVRYFFLFFPQLVKLVWTFSFSLFVIIKLGYIIS